MLRTELGSLNDRMDRIWVSSSGKNSRSNKREYEKDDELYEMRGEGKSQVDSWGINRRERDFCGNRRERGFNEDRKSYVVWDDDRQCEGSHGYTNRSNYGFRSDKTRIPSFNGGVDPKAYLEWEKKVEQVFESQNYSEAIKVRRACNEFIGYAKTWWDKLVLDRKKCLIDPIVTWGEMKRVMRKHFDPNHHDLRSGRRDLCEEFCASMRRPSMKEKSVVSPMRDSRRKATKHEYQGTHKLSNSRTRDICCWCLESGHDIIQCPKEEMVVVKKKVEVVVDVESKFVVDEANDFPPIDVECVELYAVEGESLDDEVQDVQYEENVQISSALVDSCSTSDASDDELVEAQSIHIVQEIPKDDLDNQLELLIKKSDMAERNRELKSEMAMQEKEKEMKIEKAKRESDKKSEMAIKEENERKEIERKEAKNKNNYMVQISEIESCFILYKSLRVPWYEEVYSRFHEIAGSIPSIVNPSLQDFGGVLAKRRNNIHDGRMQADDQNDFKDNQGEVRVFVDDTTMRYVSTLMSCFPRFMHIREEYELHVDFCEVFKECMKVARDIFFDVEVGDVSRNRVLVDVDFYQYVGLIGIVDNKDLYALDLNSSKLFDVHACYLLENNKWLEPYDVIKACMNSTHDMFNLHGLHLFGDMLRKCMDDKCGMLYLHDLKLFEDACQELKDGYNKFYAYVEYYFKENKFFIPYILYGLHFSDEYECVLNILHDYMCWVNMKRFANVTCGSVVAFGLGESSLHGWLVFLILCDQLLYMCIIIALGLTRSKKGRNLIFVVLNEVLLLSLHISIMKLRLEIWKFVLHNCVSVQGLQVNVTNTEVIMKNGSLGTLEQLVDNACGQRLQGKYDLRINFGVTNLLRFRVGKEQDLRTNLFEEGEYDAKSIMHNKLIYGRNGDELCCIDYKGPRLIRSMNGILKHSERTKEAEINLHTRQIIQRSQMRVFSTLFKCKLIKKMEETCSAHDNVKDRTDQAASARAWLARPAAPARTCARYLRYRPRAFRASRSTSSGSSRAHTCATVSAHTARPARAARQQMRTHALPSGHTRTCATFCGTCAICTGNFF